MLTSFIQKDKAKGRRGERVVPGALALLLSLSAMACGPNQRILNSAPETPVPISNAQNPADNFENDIQAMRNADFNYIYAFRRKDGADMDADDRKFVNTYAPAETNRKRLSDDGKVIILASNYRSLPENLKVFTDRFAFQDFSKPESEIMAKNTNSNR